MLEYGGVGISEGIDIDKTIVSKESDICHYWYFLEKNLNMSHIFAIVIML